MRAQRCKTAGAKKLLALAVLVPGLLVAGSPMVWAADITLDGDFTDWTGHIRIPDPWVKAPDPDDEPWWEKSIQFMEDIQYAYLATNEGESWLYFRVDRWPQDTGGTKDGIEQPVYYGVFFDFNNNHWVPFDPDDKNDEPMYRFQGFQDPIPPADAATMPYAPHEVDPVDSSDFILYCAFTPNPPRDQSGLLTEPYVRVYLVRAEAVFGPSDHDGKDDPKKLGDYMPVPGEPLFLWQTTDGSQGTTGDGPRWGQPYSKDTGKGGLYVEFGVPFSAFRPALEPGQAIKLFFAATLNNPLNQLGYPQQDFTQTVDWAPVPAAGPVGTLLLLAIGVTLAYLGIRRKLRGGALAVAVGGR